MFYKKEFIEIVGCYLFKIMIVQKVYFVFFKIFIAPPYNKLFYFQLFYQFCFAFCSVVGLHLSHKPIPQTAQAAAGVFTGSCTILN